MSTTAKFKEITEEVGATYLIANIYEANFAIDQFLMDVDYPVHIMLPYEVKDSGGAMGVIRSTIVLEGFFLTKVAAPTIDYKTGEVDIQAVEPMRTLGRQFFDNLGLDDIINREQETIEVSWVPAYASFDAHLHGVNYRTEIQVIEQIECE